MFLQGPGVGKKTDTISVDFSIIKDTWYPTRHPLRNPGQSEPKFKKEVDQILEFNTLKVKKWTFYFYDYGWRTSTTPTPFFIYNYVSRVKSRTVLIDHPDTVEDCNSHTNRGCVGTFTLATSFDYGTRSTTNTKTKQKEKMNDLSPKTNNSL